MDGNAISSLSWVPRGYAKEIPIRNSHYCMNDEDIERYINEHDIGDLELRSNDDIVEKFAELGDLNSESIDQYGDNFFHHVEKGIFSGNKDLYLKNIDLSDDDELNIRDSDSLLATTSIENDTSTLQVYLYSIEDGSFYVHHDTLIGDYPLCSEWLTLGSFSSKNNLLAVGSFSGEINIWNLDCVDSIYPVSTINAKRNKNDNGHSDAVMSLASHPRNSKILASGSADKSLKIWDIIKNECVNTYINCSNKVQCLNWHHTENNIIITADYDRALQLIDIRDGKSSFKLVYEKEKGDPESIAVPESNIYCNGNSVIVSTENGYISGYDIRVLSANNKKDIFSVHGSLNMKPITSICCTSIPNLLVSSGFDGVSKVWNLSSMTDPVFEKHLKGGKIFTSANCPDEDALIAFGGEFVILWNIAQEEKVIKNFTFNRYNTH
ncbi:PWP1 family protein [Cryptosporidium ryanae]|uniref:PWP1 family protein n=1 Tax=Cryptosporidium ryanae TaxID=515981 RepID=UPI00351A75CB|nr:PWP1 family protein [Cryptosporidium ryanae]